LNANVDVELAHYSNRPTVDLTRFPFPVLFATGKRPVRSVNPGFSLLYIPASADAARPMPIDSTPETSVIADWIAMAL
jgi:hypothetical protein